MNERTVLVTGAAGYVGEYVLEALKGHASRVLGLIRRENQAPLLVEKGIEPVIADVTAPDTLSTALTGVDAVIHLAAVNRNRGAATMDAINYRGTIHLLGAAQAAGVRRFVQVIGIGADSRRSSPLSRTQGMAAEAVIASSIGGTVLEAGVIFGPGDAFGTMLTGLARISPFALVPGNGRARFQPIAVQDVAQVAVNVLDRDETVGHRFEIVGAETWTLDEIHTMLFQAAGINRSKIHVPEPLMRPAVRLMERFLFEPPATNALLDLLALDVLVKENATAHLLGHPPLAFSENLGYVRDVTARQFVGIVMGKRDRRGRRLAQ